MYAAIAAAAAALCACTPSTSDDAGRRSQTQPQIDMLVNNASSWRHPAYTQTLAGLTLLRDGRPFAHANLAVGHAIARVNPRISAIDALYLADYAIAAARRQMLDPEFFCAMLLQESAFDPDALSSAGAVGIGQFTLDTAASQGVNPFDVRGAIDGSAALIAAYVRAYGGYADPYATALAAYNAGPDAVRRYAGVPPFEETQQYITYVYERWARILSEEKLTRKPS